MEGTVSQIVILGHSFFIFMRENPKVFEKNFNNIFNIA